MFVKLIILASCAAMAIAAYTGPQAGGLPAAQYPAGVSPEACPNYPNCENPAVATGQPAPQYNAIPSTQYRPVPNAIPQYTQYKAIAQQQYNQLPQYNPGVQYNVAPQYTQQVIPQYHQPAAPQFQAAPQYQQPAAAQRQYSPAEQSALDRGEYIGDGDYHGEGLAESGATTYAGQQQGHPSAPIYNQIQAQAYNPAPVAYNQIPNYHGIASAPSQAAAVHQPAQFPAGLDPSACPNYPFCS